MNIANFYLFFITMREKGEGKKKTQSPLTKALDIVLYNPVEID